MLYIMAAVLRKARLSQGLTWSELMLMPEDYTDAAIRDPWARNLMDRIEFVHGGTEFDRRYPDGIPTEVEIQMQDGRHLTSGLVMYPAGHARCTDTPLAPLLRMKFKRLLTDAVADLHRLDEQLSRVSQLTATEIRDLYSFKIIER
jgi:2-methylcitrate dehydratase